VTYPPEPWALCGQLHTSVFRVPLADLPVEPPPGWKPVRLGRYAIVGTAWVSYEPPGVLSYRELMATVLVRRGRRVVPTIIAIWVDSEASRDGGRALWGIPKDLADFRFNAATFAAERDGRSIATGSERRRWRLPRRWPVRFAIVQTLAGAAKISPVRVRAAVEVSSATFAAAVDGPLGFLAGRRPVVSVGLHDFRMKFGGTGSGGAC
jgi:hypothetical protein